MPMRVLLPSDDPALLPSLVEAYVALGYDVATGVTSLFSHTGNYDLVHLHWPEELVGWTPPTSDSIDRLEAALRWWRQRTRLVATVHNYLPHRAQEHPLDRQLYSTVYEAVDTLGHFSRYSREMIRAGFPNVTPSKQIIHPPSLYTHIRAHAVGRREARKRLKLNDDVFAALVFGTLRKPMEFELVKGALAQCGLANLQILFAGRFGLTTRFKRAAYRARLQLWRRTAPVQVLNGFRNGFLSDAETALLFEAADAVLVPRYGEHLNSGVVSLAMTMGTPIIAPDYGAYSEYLRETLNVLYAPGDSRGMAEALGVIARRDRGDISAANAAIAAGWGWNKAISAYTERLDHAVARQ